MLLVTELLRQESKLADHELGALPDAGLVWRKGQAAAKEQALVRATLPIRIVRTSAYALAFVALAWLVFSLWQAGPSPVGQWIKYAVQIDRLWPSTLNETVSMLVLTGSLFCIGLGSWYMLQQD